MKTIKFSTKKLSTLLLILEITWKAIRLSVQNIFSNKDFEKNEKVQSSMSDISSVEMMLPVQIGDYTDFYSSKNHASNMGTILRGPEAALQPNWVHLPVGYHGRASTIVVDKTKIIRPHGQTKQPDNPNPIFGQSKKIDFEVEIGAVIGKSNKMGKPVNVKNAEEHVFGLVILNDWSARDVQGWEYVPLGPFNAKNFATTISPWIITLEALEPFSVPLPAQDPTPLPYLKEEKLHSWDIPISVEMKTKNGKEFTTITTTNYKYMYWSINQQIAHHTVTGCALNVGDILGSGTISGTTAAEYGSLFELTTNGKKTITISGEQQSWVEDNSIVNMTAEIKGNGYMIGFGDCSGEILPANNSEDYN